jgi:hypothetical protein
MRENERTALFIIAIIATLAFGIPYQLLSIAEKDKNKGSPIYGKPISSDELLDTRFRWQMMTNFVISQMRNIPHQFPPYNLIDSKLWMDNKRDEYFQNLAFAVTALNHYADGVGITVSSKQIQQFISMNFQAFTDRERNFDFAAYRSILHQLQTTEAAFEKTVGELLKVLVLFHFKGESNLPLSSELFKEYIAINEEVKINWVAFKQEDFVKTSSENSPDEIQKYFSNNTKDYAVPEKIQLEYIMADRELIKNKIDNPTQDEIKDYYTRNIEDYKIIEETKLVPITPSTTAPTVSYKPIEEVNSAITSKLKDAKSKQKSIEIISSIGEKIRESQVKEKEVNLPELAKEFSISYGLTPFFSRDRINEIMNEIGLASAFSQIFEMPENVISPEPIVTEKGLVILRITKKKPEYTPPLTMALKEKVNKDLNSWKAKQAAENKAKDILNEIVKTVGKEIEKIKDKPEEEKEKLSVEINKKCFEEVLSSKGLKINTSNYFKKYGTISQMKEVSNDFIAKIFELKYGEAKTLEDKGTYYLLQISEKRAPIGEDFAMSKPILSRLVMEKQNKDFVGKWQTEIQELMANFKKASAQPNQQNNRSPSSW